MFKRTEWLKGRQGGKYEKKCLWQTRWFDMYLIRFEKGFSLPYHKDPVGGRNHYRLNFLLKGEDVFVGEHVFKFWRVVLFRADQLHGTRKLTRDRLLFSIGWKW